MRSNVQHEDFDSGVRAGLAAYQVYRKRQIFIAVVFVVFNATTYFLIVYDRLRPFRQIMEQWARDLIAGRFPAPEQYRVAIPLLALGFERITHLKVNQSVPLIEAVAYAGTLILLFRLLQSSTRISDRVTFADTIRFALFLAAAQFPVLWIFPWERHETLPSAFYVAAVVYFVAVRSRRHWMADLLLIAILGFGESLARTDIPVIAGVTLLLSTIMRIDLDRPRRQVALFGIASVVIGSCVQLYLQKVVYPYSRYPPQVPRIQLLENLNATASPEHVPMFLIALLPFFATLAIAWYCRISLLPSDKLILLMCLLYLPVWVTFGLAIEIRIFVPFLFLASPVVARVWTAFLLGEMNSGAVSG